MPKGIPNKKIEEPVKKEIVKEAPIETKKAEEKKPVLDVLQPGQKYFEAPDGEIIIGEESKSQIWHRKLNNGRGGWVNPKR